MDDQDHAHGIWHGRTGGFFFLFSPFPASILFSFYRLYMLYCYGGFGLGQHHCITSMALGQGLLFGFFFGFLKRGERDGGTERERETRDLVSSVSCPYYT